MKPEFLNRAQEALKSATTASINAFKGGDDLDAAARRRRILIFGGLAALALIAVISVVSRIGGDNNVSVQSNTTQAVSVIPIGAHTFHPTVALNGEARPQRDIQVAAPATGVRILQLLVDEGDMVRAGQPMARLDMTVAQAQIQAAQANVAEAESAAVRARGEYQRADAIRDSGALSTEAIEQRRAAMVAADARLAAARAQRQEVNGRMQGGYVRAPAAGLVISRTAEIGRSVDGQILFRIAAGNALEVAARVAESDILALQEGQSATFTLVDGSTVEGRLRRLPASIDSQTRTGEALFALPRGSRVRAGMFLRGQAELASRDVLAAPQSSIFYDSGKAYVFVVDAQNKVHRVEITAGVRDGDWVEILGGVQAGQRVVGAGAAFLQEGDTVRPLDAQQQQPAQPATGETQLRGREG
ncbi:efflux RND transporter periplasmic adaptor subunit [Terricaulis sp.]|uniref:efflux RND transporter periplasmic adaptor subunit n=1 Tax=Terricaulis sp. TaxID=2768686 RepID=UPI00378512BE